VSATHNRAAFHASEHAAFSGTQNFAAYLADSGHARLVINCVAEGTRLGLDKFHGQQAFFVVFKHYVFLEVRRAVPIQLAGEDSDNGLPSHAAALPQQLIPAKIFGHNISLR